MIRYRAAEYGWTPLRSGLALILLLTSWVSDAEYRESKPEAPNLQSGQSEKLSVSPRNSVDGMDWIGKIRRAPVPENPSSEIFGSMRWAPPVAAVKPAPASPQTAPVFPYMFMGKLMQEGEQTTVFLTKGDEVYSVSSGTVLDEVVRIESVHSDSMEVTFLSTKLKRNVTFQEIQPPPQRTPSAEVARAGGMPQLAESSQALSGGPGSAPLAPAPGSAAGGTSADGRISNPAPGSGMPGAVPNPGGAKVIGSSPQSIGGMEILPPPTSGGMEMTPPPPGAVMQMTPPPPGAVMEMTPPPASAGPTPAPIGGFRILPDPGGASPSNPEVRK